MNTTKEIVKIYWRHIFRFLSVTKPRLKDSAFGDAVWWDNKTDKTTVLK